MFIYRELKSSAAVEKCLFASQAQGSQSEAQYLGDKLDMVLCTLVRLRKDFCALMAVSLAPGIVRDFVSKEIRQRLIEGT